ncbi:Alpha/Beta hydrolase protein [Suillus paluster]|uniref:Alpha/Beta hydrolase protein n=1 Tax=Suillus paluster TaxID=48578 RepID=UPI001B87AD6D|nr:Alpha/Beta hydrolase protein [Suillus paluster]KAG1717275.1 Alpha/Beta hydrolase protein [Suillus paluster]
MLGAIFGLLNLALFKDFSGVLEQIPLGPTGDLGYATYQGNQPYPNAVDSRTTVDLGYVTYQGKLDEEYPNTVVYFGIRYAEPPVGYRRFRATVPLDTARVTEQANGEVIDATEPPNFCIQGSLNPLQPGGAGSEDCLHVNIYTPLDAKERGNLPVMVFIHGGAFLFGNPLAWPFEHWIEQSQEVIIVSVYYRLASFGFLAVPEFTNSTYGDFNVGLKDQREALRWVQSNIGKFGGNPNEVTVAGHSAGAISTELHMTVNERGPLFSRAIVQSVVRSPLPTPEQQRPLFEFYAAEAKCSTGSVEQKMDCLRNADISELSVAQEAAFLNFALEYRAFSPIVDGVLITGHPTTKFQGGDFAHVPLLIGTTSNETLAPELFYQTIPRALKGTFPLLTATDIEEFLQQYPLDDFDSSSHQYQVATGESTARCTPQAMGIPSSRYVNETWTYRYNTPIPPNKFDEIPVEHADEIWMMFRGTYNGPNGTFAFDPQTAVERAFASELIAYWLSFVRTSNPNTYKLPKSPVWKTYNEPSPVRMVLMQEPYSTIMSGSYMEKQPALETTRCEFVISKAEVCQN